MALSSRRTATLAELGAWVVKSLAAFEWAGQPVAPGASDRRRE